MRFIIIPLLALLLISGFNPPEYNCVLLKDDFSAQDTGLFSAPVGAHTEYHYLPEAGTKGNWVVSCFGSGDEWGRAWRVGKEKSSKILFQSFRNRSLRSSHPMIIAGDSLWENYKLTVKFLPEKDTLYSGIAFRYQNDRCFYFFGIKKSKVYISMFRHANNWNSLYQKVLAEKEYSWSPGEYLIAVVTVNGSSIEASLNDKLVLKATDTTYKTGKIGLVSNARARYKSVEVLTTEPDKSILEKKKVQYQQEELKLQAVNPGMVIWRMIKTEGFGVGRNLRFGDLNGDGQIDVLVGQVIHHGWPRDNYSELSCLTAMTFDGKMLWQTGTPDPEKNHLTNDVGFQIHDIDRDGKNEVIYCMNFEIIVTEGATGKIKYRVPTPESKVANDKFPQILGDCIFFCDVSGKGYDSDVLIKDRYWNFWMMNSRLEPLWEGSCKTGHYPYAEDIDGDGKDELAIGYSLYDHDGKQLWSLDKRIEDHADGVAIMDLMNDGKNKPIIMYAASNAGYLRVDLKGNVLKEYFIGHVQNPTIANFRSDKPGLETVTINFWGNQGIIHYYNNDGIIYHSFEPNQFGSMCLPLNWTGKDEEFFVHNPNIWEGGVYDGWGRRVLKFPADSHPDMCNAVLDITGDCRDEIVVWDPNEIWVYTQSDNPKKGRLYKPLRNPLYNYSNYQTSISLPGWNEN